MNEQFFSFSVLSFELKTENRKLKTAYFSVALSVYSWLNNFLQCYISQRAPWQRDARTVASEEPA